MGAARRHQHAEDLPGRRVYWVRRLAARPTVEFAAVTCGYKLPGDYCFSPIGRTYHASRFHAPTAGPCRRKRLRHPAFNVNNLEQVQAVMAAADEVGAPVILQASAGARKYAGEAFIKHLIQAAVEA